MFLKKEIIKNIDRVSLSPNIISIDDFIELVSEKKNLQKLYKYLIFMKRICEFQKERF